MNFIFDDYAEDMADFDSEAIEAIAYNRDEDLLYVEFQSGGEYIYSDVAESTYNMFKNAPSLGSFYRNFISGKYTSERVYDTNLTKRHFEPVCEDEYAYADMNIDPSAELQEAPLADWERELLGLGAVEAEDFGRKRNLVAGLAEVSDTPVSRPSRARGAIRFGVKYQIAGTGIIAESEIEADDHRDVLITFYARFASELPGHTPVVLSLTQYF